MSENLATTFLIYHLPAVNDGRELEEQQTQQNNH